MPKAKKHTEKFNNFNLIIFGGTGDLAYRKIYPAIYQRFIDGQLKCKYNIIAISRKENHQDIFNKEMESVLLKSTRDRKMNKDEISLFMKNVHIIKAKEASAEGYLNLKNFLAKFKEYQNIFYFSTPSSAFGSISKALKVSQLVNPESKVVIEKPLGHNLESSISINDDIIKTFSESQIYRIDHYLGKETVQNLMVLRFANNLFERAWDSENIDNIQITVAESLGVEKRAGYYDQSGALLDMVQNHLLQLLCLVAMEPPVALKSNEVRNEKTKVLRSLRPYTMESIRTKTIKGQYTRGNIQGQKVNSYLEDIEKYESKIKHL